MSIPNMSTPNLSVSQIVDNGNSSTVNSSIIKHDVDHPHWDVFSDKHHLRGVFIGVRCPFYGL
jgi:hypothetical protein